jgi:hypothetical protein
MVRSVSFRQKAARSTETAYIQTKPPLKHQSYEDPVPHTLGKRAQGQLWKARTVGTDVAGPYA